MAPPKKGVAILGGDWSDELHSVAINAWRNLAFRNTSHLE